MARLYPSHAFRVFQRVSVACTCCCPCPVLPCAVVRIQFCRVLCAVCRVNAVLCVRCYVSVAVFVSLLCCCLVDACSASQEDFCEMSDFTVSGQCHGSCHHDFLRFRRAAIIFNRCCGTGIGKWLCSSVTWRRLSAECIAS